MHANLNPVNITVSVPTLPTGIDADAMKSIQEGRALASVIIIPVVIRFICLNSQYIFNCFHLWKVIFYAVLQRVCGNIFI